MQAETAKKQAEEEEREEKEKKAQEIALKAALEGKVILPGSSG